MLKTKSFYAVSLLAIALVLGACSPGASSSGMESSSISQSSEVNDERHQIYLKALNAGFTGTYQEWLDYIKGADGTSILSGNNDPTGDVGRNGDVYVNTTSWDFFVKAGGVWTKVGNIMGPKGDKGDQGEPGQDGTNGTNGVDGQTPYIGNNGNWWIGTTDTGISATGPAGENGTNGTNGTDGTNGTNGVDGNDGDDGLSAYEIYKKYYPGYPGTEFDWINDLALGQLVKTVMLNFDGGTTSSYKTTYFKGEIIGTLPTTSKSYYNFLGWSINGQLINQNYYVVSNIILIALWEIMEGTIPVSSAQDLMNINNALAGTYILTNDIDLAGNEWTPLGSASVPFSGLLEGNGKTISNLTITQPNPSVGFFSYHSGIIKNLIIENIQINISNGSSFSIGALAGFSNGTVENLTLTSGDITISPKTDHVGSLVGRQSNGSIKVIESNLNLTTNNSLFTGGIIGFASNSSTIESNLISNLIFSGELTVKQGNVGGLISRTDGQYFIENSNNFADINRTRPSISIVGSTKHVGGLVGQANGNIIIKHSNNIGYIESGFGNVGGLIGYLASTSVSLISNSSNTGNINSIGGNVGGLIGIEDSGSVNAIITINNSINFGVIVGNYNVGGLIGLVMRHSEINTSSNEGIISGQVSNIGGLIGFGFRTITISESVNNGNLLGWGSVGGIIGGGYNSITINHSVNSGSVSGTSRVGGLMGYAENLNQIFVNYSVNLGNVMAINSTTDVGGIAGFLPASNELEEVYHYGSIISNGVEVNGVSFGTKVTDISTFNLAFFTTTLGWDTEVWDFTGLDIANGVYPTLKNMPVVEE